LNCGKGDGIRVPAHEIEDLVIAQLANFLRDAAHLMDVLGIAGTTPSHITSILDKAMTLAQRLDNGTTATRRPILQEAVGRIIITGTGTCIEIIPSSLCKLLELPGDKQENNRPYMLETQVELRR